MIGTSVMKELIGFSRSVFGILTNIYDGAFGKKGLIFNLFVANTPFLYPLKTSENLTVF